MNHETYVAKRIITHNTYIGLSTDELLRHVKRSLTLDILEEVLNGPFSEMSQTELSEIPGIEIKVKMTVVNQAKYKRICEEIRRQDICYVDDRGQKQWLRDLL